MYVTPILLSEAIAQVRASGLWATVMVRLVPHLAEYRVAINSADAESRVDLYPPPAFGTSPLSTTHRSQYGPESWDHTFADTQVVPVHLLRLASVWASVEVPFLPSGLALVHTHGWLDDLGRAAEPVVDESELMQAIATLLGGSSPDTSDTRVLVTVPSDRA